MAVSDSIIAVIVLLVTGVVALAFVIFLVMDYLKNKKLPHLFIALAFFVVFAAGVLLVILDDFFILLSPVVAMLAVFIPGGIAAASLYMKYGEKIGIIYAGFIVVMALVILITKLLEYSFTSFVVMGAHIPSGLIIVVLPILEYMNEKKWPALLVS